MKQDLKKNLPSALLLILLAVLILCPLIMVFAKAIVNDGRLDLYQAWENIANPDNLETIRNSMLLGVCVVLCSTVIAVPTAYLLARTQLSRHSWLDIVFMIPFMTPPYIASMGWILFMQKRGLFQQLFLYRLMVGGILLFRRTCACDEPSCVPVPYDDAQKRHAEHTCKS